MCTCFKYIKFDNIEELWCIMDERGRIRVLIADEDEVSSNLVYHIIEELGTEMEVISIVPDRVDAVDWVRDNEIHIVFSDIQIAGKSSFDMIRDMQKLKSITRYIIVSENKEFEYVKKAINYGVTDYILKPINKGEVIRLLTRLYKQILQEREFKIQSIETSVLVEENRKKLRQQFMRDIKHKDDGIPVVTENQANLEYGMKLENGIFQMVICRVDSNFLETSECRMYLHNAILTNFKLEMKELCFDLEITEGREWYYVLLNYSRRKGMEIDRKIASIFNNIMKANDDRNNSLSITIGIGDMVSTIDKLRQTIKSAQLAVEDRILRGTNRIIYGENSQTDSDVTDYIFEEFSGTISRATQAQSSNEIKESLERIEERLLEMPNITGHQILQALRGILNAYIHDMMQIGMSLSNSSTFFSMVSEGARNTSTVDSLFTYVSNAICTSFERELNSKFREESSQIKAARQYIDVNYANNVTLKELAEMSGYNPNYFSTLFKKQVKVSFNEYLMRRRLDAAKERLENSAETIESIAREIGYNDIKHFNEIFKKNVSLKPSEYRKLYSKIKL